MAKNKAETIFATKYQFIQSFDLNGFCQMQSSACLDILNAIIQSLYSTNIQTKKRKEKITTTTTQFPSEKP